MKSEVEWSGVEWSGVWSRVPKRGGVSNRSPHDRLTRFFCTALGTAHLTPCPPSLFPLVSLPALDDRDGGQPCPARCLPHRGPSSRRGDAAGAVGVHGGACMVHGTPRLRRRRGGGCVLARRIPLPTPTPTPTPTYGYTDTKTIAIHRTSTSCFRRAYTSRMRRSSASMCWIGSPTRRACLSPHGRSRSSSTTAGALLLHYFTASRVLPCC